MVRTNRILLVAVMVIFGSGLSVEALAGRTWDRLGAGAKRRLSRGNVILRLSKADAADGDAALPKATAYAIINAEPAEAMAVFFDYNSQKDYITKLKKSQIRGNRGTTTTVYYELDARVGPFGQINRYTVQDLVQFRAADSVYRMRWRNTSSGNPDMEKIRGFAMMEPIESGKMLLVYYNYVVPKTQYLEIIRREAAKQLEDVVKSIRTRVHYLKGTVRGRAYIQQQVNALNRAVGR